ncbi:glucose dehydrogenase [FAD, quinone] [Halyomorpha halys]|uniref:glucose dehydrogenase [FAD, quinone] n=1 Tax=Halyomorpha halys TaxID=286706 RepID=UPI0006D50E83|nr:glucose dehydrogenase [FAD, quinone] [Halyomorpha halys]XP_014290966.1 glucose dehydrogenase [FAD, quinone] [Halyomorpha halys]XP_014290967.1 glucose dehydrogenase [FAD, quinone] [Halyomorpha halys]XP_014290968.1 glucose dehydrogenase [FAD, quinone] [Halyomorpha halys]XP_014290969.1 glucose dehydrogenase [FAD, quinone] [Halyomorpha halys]XP_014290970.1 glucose dehydrogenase [FAD, quinone] [Halyomorpha halys]
MYLPTLLNAICFFSLSLCFAIKKDDQEEAFVEEEKSENICNQEAAYLPELVAPSGGDFFNPCPGHSTGLAGEAFSELVNALILSECLLDAPCSYPHDIGGECRKNTIFDFIVVGAGTAGAVMAARLSEVADWNVLLVEAGDDPDMTSAVPYFYQTIQRTGMDWNFQTIREKGLYNGLMGRINRWPLGKAMGGTSSIGTMLYIRGCARDFDNIAAAGNIGWAYEDVLPYFLKSEDMVDQSILSSESNRIYHAVGGPLKVGKFSHVSPIATLIQNVSTDIGLPRNYDINGISQAGFTAPTSGTIGSGERMNTVKAFLNPVKHRPNLFIIKHAFVFRVLICPKTSRAYGIQYLYRTEEVPRTLRASREVIVSAGTVGSAKLMMLSGVGPKNELELLGIYSAKNLRVGRNLIDSVVFPGAPITIDFGDDTKSTLFDMDQAYEYLTRRTGLLASIGATELVGMINLDKDESPDISMQFLHVIINDTMLLQDFLRNLGVVEEIALQYLSLTYTSNILVPIIKLLHPQSRGTIRLKSSDLDDMPIIEAKYLEEPMDFTTLIWGIKLIDKMVNNDIMRSYNATIQYLEFDGCCGLKRGTDHYWACAMSHLAGTGYDPIGTCKMGPETDHMAVVDHQLRVYGIKGLRVVDASILPISITGPPMASVVMIAEKAADMIKTQWISGYKPTLRQPLNPLPKPESKHNKFRFM